jgi:hypothetical protein
MSEANSPGSTEGSCSGARVPHQRRQALVRGRRQEEHELNFDTEVPFWEGPRCNGEDCRVARLRGLEEKVQYQTRSVHLLIRPLPRVVLVLIIRIELHMLADRKQATRV